MRFYFELVGVSIRFKKILLFIVILAFGFPVFMLPMNMKTDTVVGQIYNNTFGSEIYNSKMREWVDIVLGGSLRLFLDKTQRFTYNDKSVRKTRLNIAVYMPYGTKLELMDNIVSDFEEFLHRFQEIEQFQSRINNQIASIVIDFKPEFENGQFPYELKTLLEEKAVYTGLAEFSVSGVGQAFSNSLDLESTNYGLILSGYNYDRLMGYADQVKLLLQKNIRIEKVFVSSKRDSHAESSNYEYLFQVNNEEKILINHLTSRTINRSLIEISSADRYIGDLSGVPIIAVPQSTTSMWEVMNKPIHRDSLSYIRLKEFATMIKEKRPKEILRENQQYQIVVNYNFIGDYFLGKMMANKVIEQVSAEFPLGFSIKQELNNFWSDEEGKLSWAVVLTISIVFVICSILLNSISQPLAVIAMIPISFIGVFLTVWIFNYRFDEGGYAAMIILCGVVVNAALYILNDLNNLIKDYPNKPIKMLFLKAFNSKIVPIMLSTISMILGLLPFIFYAEGDAFWYSLAMSVTGGLIFSMLAIVIFLPIFLIKKTKKNTLKLS